MRKFKMLKSSCGGRNEKDLLTGAFAIMTVGTGAMIVGRSRDPSVCW